MSSARNRPVPPEPAVTSTVSDANGDFLLENVPAGSDVEVRFDRVEPDADGGGGQVAAAGRRTPLVQLRDAVPSRLAWRGRLPFAPGRAVLVTYDPRQRSLLAMDRLATRPR